MDEFLLGVAKGITWVAEKTGIANVVRSAHVQDKSEKVEEKVLDPAFNFVSWINENWQLAVVGVVALLVLLKD